MEYWSLVFLTSVVSSTLDNGILTVKRLPFPGLLSTWILPLRSFTVLATMESPSPKPSSVTALPNRSNGANILSCCSSVMPVPVSSTESENVPSLYIVFNVIVPLRVNLTALDSRLLPMRKINSLSPKTTSFVLLFKMKERFLAFAKDLNSASSVSTMLFSLNGFIAKLSFPLSRRK